MPTKPPFEIHVYPNVAILHVEGKHMKVPAQHCDDYALAVRELVKGWRHLAKMARRKLIVRRYNDYGAVIATR